MTLASQESLAAKDPRVPPENKGSQDRRAHLDPMDQMAGMETQERLDWMESL